MSVTSLRLRDKMPSKPILFFTKLVCGKVQIYHICISGSNIILMGKILPPHANLWLCVICGRFSYYTKKWYSSSNYCNYTKFSRFFVSISRSGKTMIGMLFSTLSLTLHIFFFSNLANWSQVHCCADPLFGLRMQFVGVVVRIFD